MILNVCEVFAPNEEAAEEARRGWISRGLTLDLMYENIPGLNNAQLDTKNFIYDELHKVIKGLI
jgi:hypothetical protein